MKIEEINIYSMQLPLKKPFSTSLHTVEESENIVLEVRDDDGYRGLGEAAPSTAVTGDTAGSVQAFIEGYLKPLLLEEEIKGYAHASSLIQNCATGNPGARAAAEIAVFDLFARRQGLPLYQLLGGYEEKVRTDMTVGVSSPEEMEQDAREAAEAGFSTLKLKVGKNIEEDLRRVRTVRGAVGEDISVRLDANQGYDRKEAVRFIEKLESEELDIELIEQPVPAHDIKGLKYVTDHVLTPVMADESLFSPEDAIRLLREEACDIFNIKLMKAGGLRPAVKINDTAESAGIECMLGCMLESRLAISAAAHLAAACRNITRLDLDAPLLLDEDPVVGGVRYEGELMKMPAEPGLGIDKIKNLEEADR